MKKLALVALLILHASTANWAADVPAVRKGTTELAGFLGASYGIYDFRVMGGANAAYAVTREIMPYAEFTYFPAIGRESSINGLTIVHPVPLSDFHGGVHIRI